MATGSLYGSVSESTGLYGIGAASGGTYFEWFIFQDSATAPATPTGGSWAFSNNTGTPPSGWVVSPPPAPVNQVWVSIAVVDSRNATTLTWSVPGLMTGSGLPILSGSGVPSSGDGLNGQLYINTATTPQSMYFKQSGAWTQLTGSNLVDLVNNQTIGGVKTFTSTIQGDISGSAGNVSGVVAVANGGTGASTASGARTNLGLGTISTQDATNVSITGGSITGITPLAVADGGTGATTASQARVNLGAVGLTDTQTLTNKTISGASNTLTNIPNSALDNDSVNVNGVDLTLGAVQLLGADWVLPSYTGNAGKVLAVNPSSSDVQWIASGGVGTVTSVDVSGGTTGLTTTGGPVVASGTITLGGTLAIANGGTGQTNATLAFNALAPSQTGNAGKFLTTNGTNTSWSNVAGAINYQGAWDASTNSPTLTSSVGVNGYYYVVSVAGATNLNGITDWQIGDWAIFNGSVWQKIDQTNTVSSVNGYTGAVVLNASDVGAAPTTRTITAGTGLTGGGDLSADRTIAIANTAVSSGSYGSASSVASFTVNSQGQLTSASNTTIAIANTQVSGLGTMSTQNANSVAITGGTINGTSIGATTPSTGRFTTLTVNDNTTLGSSNSDTTTFNGRIASEFTPSTANTYDLGRNSHEWRNLYLTGTASVAVLNASADSAFTSTGAVQLSSGTTGQRPTGAAGKLRFNTTTTEFEGYNGTTWASVGGSAISNDTSTATNLYPLFASSTTGTAANVYTSNAQYLFKPSTGELSVKAPRASNGIVVNSATISSDYTIAAGDNGMSAGPVSVNSGVTVTVSSGSVWTVV
jgi:hypothetical protein